MKRRQKVEQKTTPRLREENEFSFYFDKEITKIFRENLPLYRRRSIKDVYTALCEIQSDFCQAEGHIFHGGLTNKVSEYAGISIPTVNKYMQILRRVNLINYDRIRNKKGNTIGTIFQINQLTDSIKNSILTDIFFIERNPHLKLSDPHLKLLSCNKNFKPLKDRDRDKRKRLKDKIKEKDKRLKESSLKNNEEGIEKKIPLTTYKKNKESYNPYSEEAKGIFAYWNKLGKPLTRHTEGSKVHRKAMKDITKALEKYSVQEIEKAISNYQEILISEEYIANITIPGHKVGLDEFFGFSGFTKRRMETQKVKMPTGFISWFKTCRGSMEEWRKETKETSESLIIKKAFKKEFLTSGRVSPFTLVQEDQFLMAGRKLKKYYSELQPKFSMEISLQEFAEDLMAALREAFQTATVGNLVSNYTWSTLFPEYINKQNMIFEED